jgi:hypothetical protein
MTPRFARPEVHIPGFITRHLTQVSLLIPRKQREQEAVVAEALPEAA